MALAREAEGEGEESVNAIDASNRCDDGRQAPDETGAARESAQDGERGQKAKEDAGEKVSEEKEKPREGAGDEVSRSAPNEVAPPPSPSPLRNFVVSRLQWTM